MFRRTTFHESNAVYWIATYVGGLAVIGYIGDPYFIYENFLTPPTWPITIQPMGIVNTPYDLIVPVALGLLMVLCGYLSALRPTTQGVTSRSGVGETAPGRPAVVSPELMAPRATGADAPLPPARG